MKEVIDNFSAGSAEYAAFRPESPNELFEFLYKNVSCFDVAWDCGTGNGQVAVKLAHRFNKVYATDISAEQLQRAATTKNVEYRTERAEHTSLPDQSVDLITVAQAIHWFDFDRFYDEVRRVGRHGSIIAAWTYTNIICSPAVNEVIANLYWNISRPYWDKERDYVDASYKTIPFPFKEISSPEFAIMKQVTLEQLAGYLRTWSGIRHYIRETHSDPITAIMDDLRTAWGTTETQQVIWPVFMRAGYVHH